jgi:hypothetical protein
MKHLINIVLIQIWKQNIFLHTIFFIFIYHIIYKYIKLNCNVKVAENEKKEIRQIYEFVNIRCPKFLLGLIEIEKDIQLYID